jgi:hypothetical protein
LQQLKLAGFLLKKKLGFRTLLDVIPLDASLVKGSHGRLPSSPDEGPLVITKETNLLPSTLEATDVMMSSCLTYSRSKLAKILATYTDLQSVWQIPVHGLLISLDDAVLHRDSCG